ncbi:MarR family winged helix-turn-helix transcriptional regulator [Sneathiella glossodoripedis]|uniref:MarR family winged helix-turn-helix transcriptional regulator n=1 Tax=Sneathiella glossodoripedis TaxID=418853 RepID=UPI00046E6F5D|nr:MarR family transcriptional regulator [Sneathiella glossodoripedis]
MDRLEETLVALRQIMRATELNGRKLAQETGLSTSQLLAMQALNGAADMTAGAVAKEINLSQATVSTLLDKLEARGLILRERGQSDKRKVFVKLTDLGRELVTSAPTALQDRFANNFAQLEAWEQSMIASVMGRLASLMGASELDAAPVLHTGAIDKLPSE